MNLDSNIDCTALAKFRSLENCALMKVRCYCAGTVVGSINFTDPTGITDVMLTLEADSSMYPGYLRLESQDFAVNYFVLNKSVALNDMHPREKPVINN